MIRKGRSARGLRGLLAALLAIAIAAAAMTGTAFAADAGNGSNGPEIAHLALGNSLQPASLRSHSDTTYGWCAAEISRPKSSGFLIPPFVSSRWNQISNSVGD